MRAIRAAAIVVVAGGLLVLLDYLAPLQGPTVAAYTGLTILFTGLLCILRPLRFLGIAKRWHGGAAALAGAALLTAGLIWPVKAVSRTARITMLDEFLPEYHFHEWHGTRVHATPERVSQAAWQLTFSDISAFQTLGFIRNAAMGSFRQPPVPVSPTPILQIMSSGSGGFFPLARTRSEYVFGMAGRPWTNQPVRKLTPDEFLTYRGAGSVRIAFNFFMQEEGSGWTRLSTETRVQAMDAGARDAMARYWRLIYPGSGLLRRAMLNAIRERAEAGR